MTDAAAFFAAFCSFRERLTRLSTESDPGYQGFFGGNPYAGISEDNYYLPQGEENSMRVRKRVTPTWIPQ